MPASVTRRLLFAAAVLLVAAVPSTRTFAAPGAGSGTGSGGNDEGVLTAGVVIRTGDDHNGGGGGGGSRCTWERLDGDVVVPRFGSSTFPFTDDRGVTFYLWHKLCDDGSGDFYLVPDTEPEDLLPGLLEDLKQRALPTPDVQLQPLDPREGWAFVTVPLDFRLPTSSWRAVQVTASVGSVWATVTATPVRLTFDPGDPNGSGPVECTGDAPVAGYDPVVPGACSYTYRNASSTSPFDGYHFETTTTIDWAISWTSSTGAGGSLAPYSTSGSALLAVAEVKGLVTCTGSRAEQGGC